MNILKLEIGSAVICLTRVLSLIVIGAIWLLSVVFVDDVNDTFPVLYWLPKLLTLKSV